LKNVKIKLKKIKISLSHYSAHAGRFQTSP
jgi:hypothetical protein